MFVLVTCSLAIDGSCRFKCKHCGLWLNHLKGNGQKKVNKRVNEETDSRRVEEEENNLRRNIKRESSLEKGVKRKQREDEQTVSFMYWLSVSQGLCNALRRSTFQGRCMSVCLSSCFHVQHWPRFSPSCVIPSQSSAPMQMIIGKNGIGNRNTLNEVQG